MIGSRLGGEVQAGSLEIRVLYPIGGHGPNPPWLLSSEFEDKSAGSIDPIGQIPRYFWIITMVNVGIFSQSLANSAPVNRGDGLHCDRDRSQNASDGGIDRRGTDPALSPQPLRPVRSTADLKPQKCQLRNVAELIKTNLYREILQ